MPLALNYMIGGRMDRHDVAVVISTTHALTTYISIDEDSSGFMIAITQEGCTV